MDLLVTISIILVLIAIALCYPPIFVIILVILIPRFGFIPLIVYLFGISIIYSVKRRGGM